MNAPVSPIQPKSPLSGNIAVNNLATYAGALAAGAIFYAISKYGITAPAGSEATIAGLFAAVLGHLAGKFTGATP